MIGKQHQMYVATAHSDVDIQSRPRTENNLPRSTSHSSTRYSPYPANKSSSPTSALCLSPAQDQGTFDFLALAQPHPQALFDPSEFLLADDPDADASDSVATSPSPISGNSSEYLSTPELVLEQDFDMAGPGSGDQTWDFVSRCLLEWVSCDLAYPETINPLQLYAAFNDNNANNNNANQHLTTSPNPSTGISPSALSLSPATATHPILPTAFSTSPYTSYALPASLPPAPLRSAASPTTSSVASPPAFFSGSALAAPTLNPGQMHMSHLGVGAPQQQQQQQEIYGAGLGMDMDLTGFWGSGMDLMPSPVAATATATATAPRVGLDALKLMMEQFSGVKAPSVPGPSQPQTGDYQYQVQQQLQSQQPTGRRPSSSSYPTPSVKPSSPSSTSSTPPPSTTSLSPEEAKLERRREINRKSARTLRNKRKTELTIAQEALEEMRAMMEKERKGRERAEEILRQNGLEVPHPEVKLEETVTGKKTS